MDSNLPCPLLKDGGRGSHICRSGLEWLCRCVENLHEAHSAGQIVLDQCRPRKVVAKTRQPETHLLESRRIPQAAPVLLGNRAQDECLASAKKES